MNIQSLRSSDSFLLDDRFGTYIYTWTDRTTNKCYWLKVWTYVDYIKDNINTSFLVQKEAKLLREMAKTELAHNFPKIVGVKLNHELLIDDNKTKVHIQVFERLPYKRPLFQLRKKMPLSLIRKTLKNIVSFMKVLHNTYDITLLEWSPSRIFLDSDCNPIFLSCYHTQHLSCQYDYTTELTLGINCQLRCPEWSSRKVNLVSSDSFQLGLLVIYLYIGIAAIQSNAARDDIYRLLNISRYDFKENIEKRKKKAEDYHAHSDLTWKLIFDLIDPCDKMRLRPDEVELTDWWKQSLDQVSANAVKELNDKFQSQQLQKLKKARQRQEQMMNIYGRRTKTQEEIFGGNRGRSGEYVNVPTALTISKDSLINCFFVPCAIEQCEQTLKEKFEGIDVLIQSGDKPYTMVVQKECPSFMLLLSFYIFEDEQIDVTIVKYTITEGEVLQCYDVVCEIISQVSRDSLDQ